MKHEDHILLVNIGNTNTTIRHAHGGHIRGAIQFSSQPPRYRSACIESLRKYMRSQQAIDGVVICSVIPSCTNAWRKALKQNALPAPVIVSSSLNLGYRFDYPAPATIGADRLANMSGAVLRHPSPLVTVDIGTAVTFEVVDHSGRFIGGAIAPGPGLFVEYMAMRTALLPHIDVSGRVPRIGKSTVTSMRIGARVGYAGMLGAMYRHLAAVLGNCKPVVVVTGGGAATYAKAVTSGAIVRPQLTFEGMCSIYLLNH